jgi:hypothetical protein
MYALLDIIKVIKSRRMRLTVHGARVREMRNKILVRKLEGKAYWEDLGADGRILLEWI